MGMVLDGELQALRLRTLQTQLYGLTVRVPKPVKMETWGDVDVELFAGFGIAHEVPRKVSSDRCAELARPRRDNVDHRRAEFLCYPATAIEILNAELSFFSVSARQPFYYGLKKRELAQHQMIPLQLGLDQVDRTVRPITVNILPRIRDQFDALETQASDDVY